MGTGAGGYSFVYSGTDIPDGLVGTNYNTGTAVNATINGTSYQVILYEALGSTYMTIWEDGTPPGVHGLSGAQHAGVGSGTFTANTSYDVTIAAI